jgi:AraC-like DNA-binding protein
MTSAPLIFTTRGVPEPSRRRVLHTLCEQGLLPVEPLRDAVPRVELVKWRLPGASVLWGRFAGVRQVGDPSASGDDLFFAINTGGTGLARQRGREVRIGAGGAVAVGPHDGPFTVLRQEPNQMIGVRLAHHGPAGDAPLRLVPRTTPALELLARYLRSLLGAPVPSSPLLADAVVAHITELIALSLRDERAVPPAAPGVRAARMAAIRADIDQHLTDPALGVAAIARRQGISARYVHRLFADEAQTYSAFVLDRRLDLVHRRLADRRFADRPISTIATDAGFADLSYFNRTFRGRYGTTPTDVRRDP